MTKKRFADIENRKQKIRNTVETLFRQLLISGVAHELLEPLKAKLMHLAGKDGIDENGITAYLKDELAAMIKTDAPFLFKKPDETDPDENRCSKPIIAVMVGTTGVGKTTTLAKIAAQVTLKSKLKTVFLTIDTYRIAATQQLSVLGDIIGIPTEVVYKERDLLPTIEQHPEAGVILIDTAGRSQRNNLELLDIQKYLDALDKFEPVIFLVVSANLNVETMRDILKRFARIKITRLVFTKADETVTLGAAFTIAAESGFPVAYICNGQNIPDDINIPTPEYIVNKLMSHNETDLSEPLRMPDRAAFNRIVTAARPDDAGGKVCAKLKTDDEGFAARENIRTECADNHVPAADKTIGSRKELIQNKTGNGPEKTICDIATERIKRSDPASLLVTDTIEIEVGRDLIAMGGEIAECISKMREHIVLQTGFIAPPVRIRDHIGGCAGDEYVIKFKGREVSRQRVKTRCLMMICGTESCGIAGTAFTEPAFGVSALWIDPDQAESARRMGHLVSSIPLVIATHMKELVIKNAGDLMGIRECRKITGAMERSNPELVAAVMDAPRGIGERSLLTIFKSLLKENISIKSAITIFECVFDCLPEHAGDIEHITSRVKTVLKLNGPENTQKSETTES